MGRYCTQLSTAVTKRAVRYVLRGVLPATSAGPPADIHQSGYQFRAAPSFPRPRDMSPPPPFPPGPLLRGKYRHSSGCHAALSALLWEDGDFCRSEIFAGRRSLSAGAGGRLPSLCRRATLGSARTTAPSMVTARRRQETADLIL